MTMKISYATQQKKKRDLERDVLTHLQRRGPSKYDALYLRFDLAHSGEIQPVLHGLNEYGYIEVNAEKMVTITTFGLEGLEEERPS
jgi:DNA-binding PadR family transcriptional regulator